MLQNLVIMSVIWPRPPKYKVFCHRWATRVKMFSCFFTMTVNHGNVRFYKKKSDICWEESLVHRKKVYELLFIQYIYFCTNVLYVKWNLACPTVHFIFLMLPQIHKNTKNIHEKNILGGHPVALVGQAKDLHQHHIWCFPLPCTGEKWLRGWEEFDSLSENRLVSFDQQAICN